MHDLANFLAVVGAFAALRYLPYSVAAMLIYGVVKFIPDVIGKGWDVATTTGQGTGYRALVWIGVLGVLALIFGGRSTAYRGGDSPREKAQAQSNALNEQLYQQRQFDNRMKP